MLCLAQCLAGLGRMAIRIFRGPVRQSASAPINPERRRFLQAGVGVLAAAPFMLSGYGAASLVKTSRSGNSLFLSAGLSELSRSQISIAVFT